MCSWICQSLVQSLVVYGNVVSWVGVISVWIFLTAAAPFVASEFLKKYAKEFFSDVYPKQSLRRLERNGVISDVVRKKIEDESNKQEAKEILFGHLSDSATTATLSEWCDVAIEANGYPKMQELGKKMKAALP